MKSIILRSGVLSGLLILSTTALASVNNHVVMAKCQLQNDSQSLRLSRHFAKKEAGLIEFYDHVSEEYKRIPAKVAYTNAGARAIFTYSGGKPFIVIGTGHSQVIFNSKVFECATDF